MVPEDLTNNFGIEPLNRVINEIRKLCALLFLEKKTFWKNFTFWPRDLLIQLTTSTLTIVQEGNLRIIHV